MAITDHIKNTQLMTSVVVALVAVVGLVMVYSDSSVPVGAATQLMPNAVDAGQRCGECAKGYLDTNVWDYKKCPRMTDLNNDFGMYSTKLTYDCCKNECQSFATNLYEDYYSRHCGEVCKGAADCAFGYCRYSGGYTK